MSCRVSYEANSVVGTPKIGLDDLPGTPTDLRHPAHEELGTRFGQSLSSALVYDFEVGGIEDLRAGGFF
jgi:hypothetical protein